MKKQIVYIIFLTAIVLYAQAPDTLWTKTYGGSESDYGNAVLQTSDGGYIIAGATESFGGGEGNVWILKTDSCGDILWTKIYGGMWYDFANSIQPTTDDGYIVVGETYSFGHEVWLLKLDANGDTLWTKVIDADNAGLHSGGTDVKQTTDGGYIITANYHDYSTYHTCLIKTDSLGDTLWIQEGPQAYGRSVQQTSDGGYISTGDTDPGMGGHRFYLWRTNTNGYTLWIEEYGNAFDCFGLCILETADSGFIACGRLDADICLLRADENGDTLWTKRFNYNGLEEGATSLDITSDNGYIIVGTTLHDGSPNYAHAVSIRTDSLGDTLWTRVYGDSLSQCGFKSVQQTSDNGYIIVGFTNASGAGGADVWLVRLGSDVGIEGNNVGIIRKDKITTTIFSGPLQLPEGKKCRVFDITGRVVEPDKITRGIYFIEVDEKIVQKVIKIR